MAGQCINKENSLREETERKGSLDSHSAEERDRISARPEGPLCANVTRMYTERAMTAWRQADRGSEYASKYLHILAHA